MFEPPFTLFRHFVSLHLSHDLVPRSSHSHRLISPYTVLILGLVGNFGHVFLRSSRRHIEKREDPGDGVGRWLSCSFTHGQKNVCFSRHFPPFSEKSLFRIGVGSIVGSACCPEFSLDPIIDSFFVKLRLGSLNLFGNRSDAVVCRVLQSVVKCEEEGLSVPRCTSCWCGGLLVSSVSVKTAVGWPYPMCLFLGDFIEGLSRFFNLDFVCRSDQVK